MLSQHSNDFRRAVGNENCCLDEFGIRWSGSGLTRVPTWNMRSSRRAGPSKKEISSQDGTNTDLTLINQIVRFVANEF